MIVEKTHRRDIADVMLRYPMQHCLPLDAYNFEQFKFEHLIYDLWGMVSNRGIHPGDLAPDFTLTKVGGGLLSLSDLRDKPVLLHFTSISSPLGIANVEPLKKLYVKWSNHVHFVEVFTRQTHPGPGAQPYRTLSDKIADAERYQREERIPWPVVVDDLGGTAHQVYGGMVDPSYLIDLDGRVSYYNMWTYAPHLYTAILALLNKGGTGVVKGGIEHRPHLTPPLVDGWRGLERGLPQSADDMNRVMPGSVALFKLGHQFKPMLSAMTLRANPAPNAVSALPYGILAAVVIYLLAKRRD